MDVIKRFKIAHVFYLAGFIESWGRGIEKICQACRGENVPLPESEERPCLGELKS